MSGERVKSCPVYIRTVKISSDYTRVYREHLRSSSKDFSKRFEDISSPEVIEWHVNPFVDIQTADLQFPEEFIDFSTDKILKDCYQKKKKKK